LGVLKRNLINLFGQIFLKSRGERYMAEVFVKSLIAASWDDPEGLLALADYEFAKQKNIRPERFMKTVSLIC